MKVLYDFQVKPYAGEVYRFAWKAMQKSFWPLLLVMIIVGLTSPSVSIKAEDLQMPGIIAALFALAFALFIGNPIKYGADYIFLKAVRGNTFEVREIFDGFKNYLNVVLAALLTTSIIVGGFLLLIIPGIVFACRLAFVSYLVMDKELEPIAAIEESWRLTKGYGWNIFGMAMLTIPIVIGGLLALIFGVFVSITWISTAFATMYQAVIDERAEEEHLYGSMQNDFAE